MFVFFVKDTATTEIYTDTLVPYTTLFRSNDIDAGRTPEQVRDDFRAFVARIRRDLPDVPIAWLAIKPSLARVDQLPAQQHANALVRSEEHTSELQSLMRNSYAVFCLKKKTNAHNKFYARYACIYTTT